VHLDQAFVDKRLKTVVEPAGANAQLLRDFALSEVGVGLQHAQHPKVGVFLQLGAAGGHVCLGLRAIFGTLPPCCVTVSKRSGGVCAGQTVCANLDYCTLDKGLFGGVFAAMTCPH